MPYKPSPKPKKQTAGLVDKAKKKPTQAQAQKKALKRGSENVKGFTFGRDTI